jgi:hypothetical protein
MKYKYENKKTKCKKCGKPLTVEMDYTPDGTKEKIECSSCRAGEAPAKKGGKKK